MNSEIQHFKTKTTKNPTFDVVSCTASKEIILVRLASILSTPWGGCMQELSTPLLDLHKLSCTESGEVIITEGGLGRRDKIWLLVCKIKKHAKGEW